MNIFFDKSNNKKENIYKELTKLDRNEMTQSELREAVNSFLKENNNGTLATCGNDRNQPRCSPVMYYTGEVDGEVDIYIPSAGGTKFGEIEENSQICFLVANETSPHHRNFINQGNK